MRRTTIDRVMADARAASFTKRSIKTSMKEAGLRIAISMVDLTTLEGKDSPQKVRSLCAKAVKPDAKDPTIPHVGAICVYPELVEVAYEALAGSGVHLASVATGFPSGQYPIDLRLEDVRRAIESGADEIDMVISRGALLAGEDERVHAEIRAVKDVCTNTRTPDGQTAHLKVILETGELETYDLVRWASDLAIDAGADFIKTSTGKIAPAATMGVTLVMLEAIREHYLRTGVRIGMKPAGGIKTAKQSLHYLVMVKETLGDDWLTPDLFRFGASSLLNDLLMQLGKIKTGHYMAAHDFSEA